MSHIQNPIQVVTRKSVSPNGLIHVDFPVVIGMINQAAQEKINNDITSLIYSMVSNQINEYLKAGYKREQINVTVTYEIKTNERGVLSLSITAFFSPVPAAHPMTIVRSLTFDINTGKSYQLWELFKPDSNYIEKLNAIILKQIKDRGIDLLDGFKSVRPDQDYYLADKSLVIYYQLYEITPYYFGFPMFPISLYEIQDMIPDNSLLSNFTVNA